MDLEWDKGFSCGETEILHKFSIHIYFKVLRCQTFKTLPSISYL